MRFLACCLVLILAACCCAEEPAVQLPKTQFKLNPSDPAWLGAAVQLHGHLGPWLVAGVRIGAAGLRTAGADGYFDVDGALADCPTRCRSSSRRWPKEMRPLRLPPYRLKEIT